MNKECKQGLMMRGQGRQLPRLTQRFFEPAFHPGEDSKTKSSRVHSLRLREDNLERGSKNTSPSNKSNKINIKSEIDDHLQPVSSHLNTEHPYGALRQRGFSIKGRPYRKPVKEPRSEPKRVPKGASLELEVGGQSRTRPNGKKSGDKLVLKQSIRPKKHSAQLQAQVYYERYVVRRASETNTGEYIWTKHQSFAKRYEILDQLGKGSFGVVLRGFDHKEKRQVALKVIKNRRKLSEQALIELSIVKFCNEHAEGMFVQLLDFFTHHKHIVLCFELLHNNLYENLKNNKFVGVSESLGRCLATQLLFGLAFLEGHGIVHTDIKPENVMLVEKGSLEVRLIDFGSSCFMEERIYSYIQSRYYRSPQVILELEYGLAIDMWSLGCLIVELFLGYPLFPGQSELEQLALIEASLGPMPISMSANSPKDFFDQGNRLKYNISKYEKKLPHQLLPLRKIFSKDSFVDFIERVLVWEPEKRMRPREALNHEWVTEGLSGELAQRHRQQVGVQQ